MIPRQFGSNWRLGSGPKGPSPAAKPVRVPAAGSSTRAPTKTGTKKPVILARTPKRPHHRIGFPRTRKRSFTRMSSRAARVPVLPPGRPPANRQRRPSKAERPDERLEHVAGYRAKVKSMLGRHGAGSSTTHDPRAAPDEIPAEPPGSRFRIAHARSWRSPAGRTQMSPPANSLHASTPVTHGPARFSPRDTRRPESHHVPFNVSGQADPANCPEGQLLASPHGLCLDAKKPDGSTPLAS
jgi:hypothetical protein